MLPTDSKVMLRTFEHRNPAYSSHTSTTVAVATAADPPVICMYPDLSLQKPIELGTLLSTRHQNSQPITAYGRKEGFGAYKDLGVIVVSDGMVLNIRDVGLCYYYRCPYRNSPKSLCKTMHPPELYSKGSSPHWPCST